jgi:DnaJ-related protein SCJ1
VLERYEKGDSDLNKGPNADFDI